MTLGGRRFLLTLAIVAASVCLALGVSLPIIKLTKFVFFTYEHSLISTVNALIRSGQLFLGITVLIFSIVLPVTKLLYLLLLSTLPQRELRRLVPPAARARMARQVVDARRAGAVALDLLHQEPGRLRRQEPQRRLFLHRRRAVHDPVLRLAPDRRDRSRAGRRPAPARKPQQPFSTMRNFAFSFLIILATVFFALGVMLPAIRFTTVFVWTNQHSVATIIWALWKNEEFFLCFVIFMFSIVFPFMKLFYLLTLVTSPDMPAEFRNKSISAMEWLGRYSMTDVMVLALMIFYINASGYTEATVLPGIYFFAASAIMTMLAYGWANSVTPGLGAGQASRPSACRRASPSSPAASPAAAPAAGLTPPTWRTTSVIATRARDLPHRQRRTVRGSSMPPSECWIAPRDVGAGNYPSALVRASQPSSRLAASWWFRRALHESPNVSREAHQGDQ